MKSAIVVAKGLCCVFLVTGYAYAQNPNAYIPKKTDPPLVLTDAGKALESKCASIQTTLKAELEKAIPKLGEAKIAAWMQAVQAEEGSEKEASAKAVEVEKLQGAAAKLRELEDQLKYAPQTLEDAKEDLARARARGEEDPEKMKLLERSEGFLRSRERDIAKLDGAIAKTKQDVEDAKVKLPDAIKAAAAAKQAHDSAMAASYKAMDALGAGPIISSGALDAKLLQHVILKDATPAGLAEFAQQSPENQKLVEELLANKDLMLQMLINDGASGGKYAQAMKIYTDIQKASPKAKSGIFQRLAMAVSLAHATPIVKRDRPTGAEGMEASDSDTADQNAKFIDPVKRYLSYEKWHEAGELQKGFDRLNVWNLRRVVDCADPDEMLAWGRQMLHALRPDCIPDNDDTLVYVNVVDNEIAYGSSGLVNDLMDKHFMQNILANGGICGRRGFFCRFILQAFGVPSTERVEPGHSTVTLWHPSGWQTRLGGNFGRSAFGFYSKMGGGGGGYGADVNFVRSSEAREDEAAYIKVKRAEWIASLMGEQWKPGLITYSGKTRGPAPLKPGEVAKPSAWSDLALYEQRRIIAGLQATKPKPSPIPAVAKTEPSATGKASVDTQGVITIPSAACSSPTENLKSLYRGRNVDRIVFLQNKAGKTVLHYSRYAKETDAFEYTFNAPKAGTYQLVADIATPKPNQKLFATANGGTPVEMVLPYTIGLWGKTTPVSIDLKAGSNVLKFSGPVRATFDQFTLTPTN